MLRRSFFVPAALALALTGCGAGAGGAATSALASPTTATSVASSSSTTPSAPSLPDSATSDDPQIVAESLTSQIPQITAVVKITESNDSNNLIGRPGKYDAASWIKDSRLTCSLENVKNVDTSCGAKIERWPTQADAQARADYLQKIYKDAPILGSEYTYVRGNLLLRVAGDLKPSQAKVYETAFMG